MASKTDDKGTQTYQDGEEELEIKEDILDNCTIICFVNNLLDEVVDASELEKANKNRKITHSMITANPERKNPEEEYFTLVK